MWLYFSNVEGSLQKELSVDQKKKHLDDMKKVTKRKHDVQILSKVMKKKAVACTERYAQVTGDVATRVKKRQKRFPNREDM